MIFLKWERKVQNFILLRWKCCEFFVVLLLLQCTWVLHTIYRNSKANVPSKIHNLKNGCKPHNMMKHVGKGGGSRGGGGGWELMKVGRECMAAGDQVFLVRRVRLWGGLAGRLDAFYIWPSLANIAKCFSVIKSFILYALRCFLREREKDDIPAKLLIFFLSCSKCVDVCVFQINCSDWVTLFFQKDWRRKDVRSGSSLYVKMVWNLAHGSLISCTHNTSTAFCCFHSVMLDNSHCVLQRMFYLSEDVGEMGIHLQA